MFRQLKKDYEFKVSEKYTIAILCGKIRIREIPVKVRRGRWCRSLYIAAFRYARDSGKGRDRFMEDYAFLCQELKSTLFSKEFANLKEAYVTVRQHGIDMKYFD